MNFKLALAFVRRDFLVESRYRTALVAEAIKSILPTSSLYFIGKSVGGGNGIEIMGAKVTFFEFALIGIAFSQYVMMALGSFNGIMQRQQSAGCLEAVLSTKTSPSVVVLLSTLYSFLAKSVHFAVVLAMGAFLFDADFSRLNLISFLPAFFLSALAFMSIAVFSGSAIILLKRGDPVTWVVGALGTVFGGAFFPREVLEGWAGWISWCNPATYAMESLRLSAYGGAGMPSLWKHFSVLSLSSAVLLPLGLWTFHLTVEKCRREGTLMLH